MSKSNPMDAALPTYEPASGCWRPNTRKKLIRDTAETMMEVQEYAPPRQRRVNPLSLPAGQGDRELAFKAGRVAFESGEARDSTHWHAKPRRKRTANDDTCLAAFELGWDTAQRAAEK